MIPLYINLCYVKHFLDIIKERKKQLLSISFVFWIRKSSWQIWTLKKKWDNGLNWNITNWLFFVLMCVHFMLYIFIWFLLKFQKVFFFNFLFFFFFYNSKICKIPINVSENYIYYVQYVLLILFAVKKVHWYSNAWVL